MNRDTLHKWLFCKKEGAEIKFPQKGMPFAVFKTDAVFGGSVEIGGAPCRIRICHVKGEDKSKHYEVRFPDTEYGEKVPLEKTTLVGYMTVHGNWREGLGQCIFHPIETDIEYEGVPTDGGSTTGSTTQLGLLEALDVLKNATILDDKDADMLWQD